MLFDITPNIVSWDGISDSLGNYMDSLQKLKAFNISMALPAHRNQSELSIYGRIDQILFHHFHRLQEILDILRLEPGLSGYEIASRLSWDLKNISWEDFPVGQKYFALRETMSHLDRLLCTNEIQQYSFKDTNCYRI